MLVAKISLIAFLLSTQSFGLPAGDSSSGGSSSKSKAKLPTSAKECKDLAEKAENPKKWHDFDTAAVPVGCSGVNWVNNVVTIYYGNNIDGHAAHIAYHYSQYESHAEPWPVNSKMVKEATRKASTHGVKTEKDKARDEKMPAFFHHDGQVTVAMLPDEESQVEKLLLAAAQRHCAKQYGDDYYPNKCHAKLVDHRSIGKGKWEHIKIVKDGDTNKDAEHPATVDQESNGKHSPSSDPEGPEKKKQKTESSSDKKEKEEEKEEKKKEEEKAEKKKADKAKGKKKDEKKKPQKPAGGQAGGSKQAAKSN